MATTVSRSRRALEARSGGKIVRPRRPAGPRTPYDRPLSNPPPPAENPNWLSRLISSPTRTIASGAGKLISTVFGPDSSSSSSSSSSEDVSDDDDGGGEEDNDVSSPEDDGLIKRNGASEKNKFFRKELPETVGKSNNKHVIEQLLLQETFSREECDRLTKIIKSRVVGSTPAEDANVDTPDLSGTAVTEAKKWLKEKRLGSTSKSDLDHRTCTLSSLMYPQSADDEGGSPVDVAKLYMRARPPWASPPSSIGMQLFSEETPYSIGGNSVSTSKLKRDFPATGSWNIQDEIRRVRSKATEELLRSTPTRIDWSASALESRRTLDSFPDAKQKDEIGNNLHTSEKAVAANVNFSLGVTTSNESNVLETRQGGLQKEGLPLPAIISSEQNQDLDVASIDGKRGSHALDEMLSSGQRLEVSESMKTAPSDAGGGVCGGHKDTNGTEHQNPLEGGTVQVGDSKLHDITCSTTRDVIGSGRAYTTNGFPSSVVSLSAQLDTEENDIINREINPVSSSHEDVAIDLTVDETHEFLNGTTIDPSTVIKNDVDGGTKGTDVLVNEATLEVHESNDGTKGNDFALSGSQNSSSMPDESSQELTQPNLRSTQASKASTAVEKQKGKRITRYNRRGRARGK